MRGGGVCVGGHAWLGCIHGGGGDMNGRGLCMVGHACRRDGH